MSGKYYAVRVGKNPGIYDTWQDCSYQVIGYKGAEYKKFNTIDEARDYIKETLTFSDNVDFDSVKANEMIVYVDGSYNDKTGEFGYGVVSFTDKGKESYGGKFASADAAHRNVSGELYAAMHAMDKALEEGKEKLYIHYDYSGIERWAIGEWKTNVELTRRYKRKFDEVKDKLKICFIKVKAHSNDPYNDEADKLAREACGI